MKYILILLILSLGGIVTAAPYLTMSTNPAGPLSDIPLYSELYVTTTFQGSTSNYVPISYTHQLFTSDQTLLDTKYESSSLTVDHARFDIYPGYGDPYYTLYCIVKYYSVLDGKTYYVSNSIKVVIINPVTASDPTAPTNLSISNITSTSFDLSWDASIDPDGDALVYTVYKNDCSSFNFKNPGILKTTVDDNEYCEIRPCTNYKWTIRATDSKGNTSPISYPVYVTIGGCRDDLTLVSTANDVYGRSTDFLASDSIIASNKLSYGAIVHMGANNSIRLIPGFKVITGSTLLGDLNGYVAPKTTEATITEEEKQLEVPNGLLSDIAIYPNPSTGIITIGFAGIEGNKKVEVFSISGSLIYQSIYSEDNAYIDLSNQPKGLYIIKINHAGGNYQNKLILN